MRVVFPHHLLPLPFYLHLMQGLRVRNWDCLHASCMQIGFGLITIWLPIARGASIKIVSVLQTGLLSTRQVCRCDTVAV